MINATGVYVDAIRKLDDPADRVRALAESQPGDAPGPRPFVPPWYECDARPSHRRRPRSVHDPLARPGPRRHHRYAGGRDSRSSLGHSGRKSPIFSTMSRRYLVRSPQAGDVLSTFAGLRPLLRSRNGQVAGSTAKLSREHAVIVSDSGLVTITGGKWTTYRRMAIDAVDHAARVGGLTDRPSTTDRLELHGWQAEPDDRDDALAIYGSDASRVRTPLFRTCRLGATAASSAPLSHRRSHLGRATRGRADRRGCPGAPDAIPLPRCSGEHRGCFSSRRVAGDRAGEGSVLARSTGRGVPRTCGGLSGPAAVNCVRTEVSVARQTRNESILYRQKQSMGSSAMNSRASSSESAVPKSPTGRQRS